MRLEARLLTPDVAHALSHDAESFTLGKDGMVDAWIPLRSAGSTGVCALNVFTCVP